ncbi:MAG: hypothetical protein QOH72_1662 [Solirubrobacteraceae bacterium]|nr:hypothetical protein [Solirubrobacteraceae bacterium]
MTDEDSSTSSAALGPARRRDDPQMHHRATVLAREACKTACTRPLPSAPPPTLTNTCSPVPQPPIRAPADGAPCFVAASTRWSRSPRCGTTNRRSPSCTRPPARSRVRASRVPLTRTVARSSGRLGPGAPAPSPPRRNRASARCPRAASGGRGRPPVAADPLAAARAQLRGPARARRREPPGRPPRAQRPQPPGASAASRGRARSPLSRPTRLPWRGPRACARSRTRRPASRDSSTARPARGRPSPSRGSRPGCR